MTEVESIATKAREHRLRWFGHVQRREDNYIGKRVLGMEIPGRRRRGRPKMKWMDRVESDMKELELDVEDAMDRTRWRFGISNPARCGTS